VTDSSSTFVTPNANPATGDNTAWLARCPARGGRTLCRTQRHARTSPSSPASSSPHSDEDHCGYVPDVATGLDNLENPNVPLHNTSNAPLPLWMSPLQEWTDDIIMKSGTTGSVCAASDQLKLGQRACPTLKV
jgi:hypothetical protein